MGKRRWVIRGLAATVLLSLGAVYLFKQRSLANEQVLAAREARLQPAVELAPVPVPTGLPLQGAEGVDADGAPLRWVDRPALRSLLIHRRYAELDAAFTHFEDAFAEDSRHERWVHDAADAFASPEPSMRARLEAWLEASPQSYGAHLALGAYLISVGEAQRGRGWAKDTADEDLQQMQRTTAEAIKALERAAAARPRSVAPLRQLIRAELFVGTPARRAELVARADASCPDCWEHRFSYLQTLRPRWGGSHEAMRAYARAAPVKEHHRLELLVGVLELDLANIALSEKRTDDALFTVEQACRLGEAWEFLQLRGKIHLAREELELGLADFDRALELRPGTPDVLFSRAELRLHAKKRELAGRDLLAGLLTAPSDPKAQWLHPQVVQGLVFVGWSAHEAGERDKALRVLDLAAELAPMSPDVISRRTFVISPRALSPAELAALQVRVAAAPDDLRLHQELDYALAHEERFEQVVTLWTGYLTRHPDDGRALEERGGAYKRLGRNAEALADVSRACELGITEGCGQRDRWGSD